MVLGSKWLAHSGCPCQCREGLDENMACTELITAIVVCTGGINIFEPFAFNLQVQRFVPILNEITLLCE